MMRTTHPDARYSDNMEWLLREGEEVRIGLSDFAQKAAGAISLVELPEVGNYFKKEAVFAVTESVKMANDITLPIAGTITAINEALLKKPEYINEDPYGKGWLIQLIPDDAAAINELMTATEFERYIGVFFK